MLNLSFCPLINEAAAQVAAIPTLEELYLSGTALTDTTLHTIICHHHQRLQHQHSHHQSLRYHQAGVEVQKQMDLTGSAAAASRVLRALHIDACHRLQSPLRVLAESCAVQQTHRQKVQPGWWTGLVDFRASSAAPRRHRRSGSLEDTDGHDDKGMEGAELKGAGDDAAVSAMTRGVAAPLGESNAQEGASAPLKAGPDNDDDDDNDAAMAANAASSDAPGTLVGKRHASCENASTTAVVALDPPTLWCALTTLELHNTVLHGVFGQLGVLSNLQHLTMRQCSAAAAALDRRDRRQPQQAWFEGLERCSLLHTVLLDSCDAALIEGGNMRALAQLPSLQSLSLHHARVRDADVAAFVNAFHDSRRSGLLPCRLHQLSLKVCSRLIHMPAVATLTSLFVLDLSDTAVQQNFVDQLGLCASAAGRTHALQVLRLAACGSVRDANPLADLPALRQLDLSHTPVTTAGVARLRHCRALTHLSLKGCPAIAHVRDVMAIPTLQVLNTQGANLRETVRRAPADGDDEHYHHHRHRHDSFNSNDDAAGGGRGTPRSHSFEDAPQDGFCDVFPEEDDLLRHSALHTLLLSHTRIRYVRRLGLLPWLVCLDLSATCVTDAELAKFVCTGLQQQTQTRHPQKCQADCRPTEWLNTEKDSTARRDSSGVPAVLHTLHDLCVMGDLWCSSPLSHRKSTSPPLRILSLQLCRSIFTVGVLGLCPWLTKLDLSCSNVTSMGLRGLRRCRRLTQLRLVGCKGVHDIRVLGDIASLREVDGSGCNVHSGRMIGDAWDTSGGGTAGPSSEAETTTRALSSQQHQQMHSDLFYDVKLTRAETTRLRRFIDGEVDEAAAAKKSCNIAPCVVAGLFRVFAGGAAVPVHINGRQLRRLVLDGCVNIHDGLAALGCLPVLLDLSLRNCHGITAASLDELAEVRSTEVKSERPDIANAASVSHAAFPALQLLHFSSCRLLSGSLRGLAGLPQLQRVYVDLCGITSLDEVAVPMRSRVVL